VAAGLMLAHRRLGAVAVALALAMAVARVYVGAHYTGDVVAGLILGAVVVIGAARAGIPLLRALTGAVARSPLRPIVSAPLATEGRPA